MERKLYTIITGDVHQCVLAGSFGQAITWAESNLPAIRGSEILTIQVDSGLVDLTGPAQERTSERPRATPPPATPEAPKARKTTTVKQAPGQVPEGMVLLSTLAMERGCTTANIVLILKKHGVATQRLKGIHGQPSAALETEARAAMAAPPDKGGRRKAEKRDPRSGAPKPTKAELKKLEKVARAPVADKVRTTGDRMVLVEQAAKELGLTDAQVMEIKRNGNVAGGNGWVNITQLEAYMASPNYEPPFVTE